MSWTNMLIKHGRCRRVTLDTYERELERYGGPAGMALAEQVFHADSQAVIEMPTLLSAADPAMNPLDLAVFSLDDLLAALGLDHAGRIRCYTASGAARNESGREYRARKERLRQLLGGQALTRGWSGAREHGAGSIVPAALAPILHRRRQAIAPLASQIAARTPSARGRSGLVWTAGHARM